MLKKAAFTFLFTVLCFVNQIALAETTEEEAYTLFENVCLKNLSNHDLLRSNLKKQGWTNVPISNENNQLWMLKFRYKMSVLLTKLSGDNHNACSIICVECNYANTISIFEQNTPIERIAYTSKKLDNAGCISENGCLASMAYALNDRKDYSKYLAAVAIESERAGGVKLTVVSDESKKTKHVDW